MNQDETEKRVNFLLRSLVRGNAFLVRNLYETFNLNRYNIGDYDLCKRI
jgi:hypothetical protein